MKNRIALIAVVVGALVGPSLASASPRHFTLTLDCWHIKHHRIECRPKHPKHIAPVSVPLAPAPAAPGISPTSAAPPPELAPLDTQPEMNDREQLESEEQGQREYVS